MLNYCRERASLKARWIHKPDRGTGHSSRPIYAPCWTRRRAKRDKYKAERCNQYFFYLTRTTIQSHFKFWSKVLSDFLNHSYHNYIITNLTRCVLKLGRINIKPHSLRFKTWQWSFLSRNTTPNEFSAFRERQSEFSCTYSTHSVLRLGRRRI